MNKRHYEHTLPNIRGSLSNTYDKLWKRSFPDLLPVVVYLAELVGIQTQFTGHLHLPV